MKRWTGLAVLLLLCLIPAAVSAAPPRRLVILPQASHMFVGETLAFTAHPLPVDASPDVVWNSTDRKIATVDEDGRVTAVAPGTVKIRARAKARLGVYAVRTLRVAVDPATVRLSIAQAPPVLYEGEQIELTARVEPAGSGLSVIWSSDNPRVAEVDASGRVWARSAGTAAIRASIEGGPSDSLTVSVRTAALSFAVPARVTGAEGIAENLEKIDAVRLSALTQVNHLASAGIIPDADAQRRIAILTRAFAMYKMPWMTEKTQKYWTRAYGTKKDFFPGVVYYGMPYIQHGQGNNSINRTYNEAKAIAQGYYLDSGRGYYLLSPAKRRNGMYVGSDCSSFVGMSIWGASSRNAWIRTRRLYDSPLYRTLTGYGQLRPGDILVRAGRHVVFFLYFTDASETRMMILEQGGGDAQDMHNTVCCSIVETHKYRREGYRPRRLASLSRS